MMYENRLNLEIYLDNLDNLGYNKRTDSTYRQIIS